MPPPPPTHHSPCQVFAAASSSGILEAVLRIAGHRVEAPGELAGGRIVGRQITAHAVLGAAIADQHLALHDARRAGDGVGLGAVDRVDLPALLAGLRVERNQTSVERADVDHSLPDRDAAVHGVATAVAAPLAGHLRIVAPQLLAVLRIEGVHDAPGRRRVHHAVDDDRRGFEPAVGAGRDGPREAELLDVGRVDLLQAGCSAARRTCGHATASSAVRCRRRRCALRRPLRHLPLRRMPDGCRRGRRVRSSQVCGCAWRLERLFQRERECRRARRRWQASRFPRPFGPSFVPSRRTE